MQRVGILGGGFNPPHKGHLFMVTDALASGLFDEIWVMPCLHHAFAKDADLLPFTDRYEMCNLAFDQWHNVYVTDIEQRLNLPTPYTVDLMKALIGLHPDTEFTLIIGSDNYEKRNEWHDWATLETLVKFYVIPRTDSSDWLVPGISSTMIRQQTREAGLKDGDRTYALMPRAVADYVFQKNLYRPA